MKNNVKYDNKGVIGRVIAVSSLKVDIFLENQGVGVRDLLVLTKDGENVFLEVAEINGSIASAICCGPTNGLKRGMEVSRIEGGIRAVYDEGVLGHMFNTYGQTIDDTEPEGLYTRNIYEKSLAMNEIIIDGEILWTGIKVLDFFAPMRKGFKMGLLGGAGVGKTVLIKELIHNGYQGLKSNSVFTGR